MAEGASTGAASTAAGIPAITCWLCCLFRKPGPETSCVPHRLKKVLLPSVLAVQPGTCRPPGGRRSSERFRSGASRERRNRSRPPHLACASREHPLAAGSVHRAWRRGRAGATAAAAAVVPFAVCLGGLQGPLPRRQQARMGAKALGSLGGPTEGGSGVKSELWRRGAPLATPRATRLGAWGRVGKEDEGRGTAQKAGGRLGTRQLPAHLKPRQYRAVSSESVRLAPGHCQHSQKKSRDLVVCPPAPDAAAAQQPLAANRRLLPPPSRGPPPPWPTAPACHRDSYTRERPAVSAEQRTGEQVGGPSMRSRRRRTPGSAAGYKGRGSARA